MELREVKQRFFALRNGLLADMLRKQCAAPHKLIFGLNIPQLREIAAEAGTDPALGRELWADADCRESRLLAPMVMAPDADAFGLMREVRTPEEADILCHRLLRRCPGAVAEAEAALTDADPMVRYCGLRLLLNLLPEAREAARRAADTVPFHPLTDGPVRQIRSQLADEEDNLL